MPKVMLVEDDENMLEILRMFLDLEGFEVVQCNSNEDFKNIEEISGIIQKEMPNLLVMDVHLNKLDGFELLEKLKKDVTYRGVRVLMSSGIDFTKKCKQEGADGFILKPYMPDELMGSIYKILKG